MFSWSVLTCQAVAHAIAEIDPDVPTLTTGFRRRALRMIRRTIARTRAISSGALSDLMT
jgi:hypothetical protein